MQVVVNSLITSYYKAGKGKVVLLLHGWGDSQATFAQLRTDLTKSFTVISLDLPGFGQTPPPSTTWDLDDYADFVQDFLTKIKAGKIFAIVGHSNGAAIAIRGVATEKLAPERLILLSASGIRAGKTFKRLALRAVTEVGKAASLALPLKTRARLRKKLFQSAKSDFLAAEHLRETFKRTVAQDVQSDARKINMPTLLIYGHGDTDTPALFGVQFNKIIKNSELIILDDAEHFVHHDQPEAVAGAINNFLKLS